MSKGIIVNMILKVTPHSEISSRVLFIFLALSLFCLSLCLSLCSFVLSFLVLHHLPLILVLGTVLYLLTEHSLSLSHTHSLSIHINYFISLSTFSPSFPVVYACSTLTMLATFYATSMSWKEYFWILFVYWKGFLVRLLQTAIKGNKERKARVFWHSTFQISVELRCNQKHKKTD